MLLRRFLFGLLVAISSASAGVTETIKVGVTAGPHAQILEVVKNVAAKNGLDIEVVEFSDYAGPNAALARGEVHANSFQHQPFLENQITEHGYKIESVGLTVNFPLGIYSKKHRKWMDVPDGATIALQTDPTNRGRSLLLLQDKGTIKLKLDAGLKPALPDIVENPRKFNFVEVDAAQTARTLEDVDAAAVNTNYAVLAGLDPSKDALLLENPTGPYVNVIAVRSVDRHQPWATTLVDSYRTPEIKAFIVAKFKGAVLPSW
jgi:D-methionine transport system substrate-binding protein